MRSREVVVDLGAGTVERTSRPSRRPLPTPGPPPGWQDAIDSGDIGVIEAWYEANTGHTTPEGELDVHAGSLTTTSNGQVIEGRLIHGSLNIAHAGVTVRDCLVLHNGTLYGITAGSAATNCLVEDVTIRNPGPNGPGSRGILCNGNSGGTFRRVKVDRPDDPANSGYGSGLFHINSSDVTWDLCYVAQITNAVQTHNTALTIRCDNGGSSRDVTITRCLFADGTSSAMSLYNRGAGELARLTIVENIFDMWWRPGTNYCVNAVNHPNQENPTRDSTVTGNIFGQSSNGQCGSSTWWAIGQLGHESNTVANNRALDGTPVGPQVTEDPGSSPGDPDDYDFHETWDGGIDTSVWEVGVWQEHGGQMSTDRATIDDGVLRLDFVNPGTTPYLSSAIQTRGLFYRGTWEARLKCSPVAGVINAFFTIDWDGGDGTKQEIDLEFVTQNNQTPGQGQLHLAVHAEGAVNHFVETAAVPFNPSEGWHVYRIDILDDRVVWWVDGVEYGEFEYDEVIAIDRPYQLKLNHWSSTNAWVGGPPTPDVLSRYECDWIRFTESEPVPPEPAGTKVIVDTDMKNDADDVVAMSMLFGADRLGSYDLEVVGAVYHAREPANGSLNIPAPHVISALAAWHGLGFPVATRKDGFGPANGVGTFTSGLRQEFGHLAYVHVDGLNASVPEATRWYRDTLAAAADGSITLLTIGYYTSVRGLLVSPADWNGDGLPSGHDLIAAKVDRVVSMSTSGGAFSNAEYNINRNIPAAVQFIAECPVRQEFVGWNVGNQLRTGRNYDQYPSGHIVRRALELFGSSYPTGHTSWDPITVLYLLKGEDVLLGENGTMSIDPSTGSDTWVADPEGPHWRALAGTTAWRPPGVTNAQLEQQMDALAFLNQAGG